MKIYTAFSPMLQGGIYPKFDFNYLQELKKQFPAVGINSGCFTSCTMIEILNTHIEESEPIKYKTERKQETKSKL